MKNLPLYASAALGLFLAFGHPAQAQTIISANFTGVFGSPDPGPSFVSFDQKAGVIPAANFINADSFQNGQITGDAATDNTGAPVSGLSISYNAGTEGVNSPTATTPNEQLLNGFIASSGTTAATTTISALPAGFGTYDLYVYLANATPSTGTYTYTAGTVVGGMFAPTGLAATQTAMAATSITGPFTLATATTPGNYLEFTGLSASTFQLSAAGVAGNAPINGFQIVGPASAAPEPSQVAALGVTALGLAGLIFRARRRKASAV
jgi:hypothetical protein